MYRRLLFLFILFYSLCLSVQAQTDSTKLKRWNFGVGVLTGITQPLFSGSTHLQLENYISATYATECFVQFHFSRKLAISLGLRYGTRMTNTYFHNNDVSFNVHTSQVMFELPLLVSYKILNAHKKEIISIESGVLLGALMNNSFLGTNDIMYPSGSFLIVGGTAGVNLQGGYNAGTVKLSKSFPIGAIAQMKLFLEYNLSPYYESKDGIGVEYYSHYPRIDFFDKIELRHQSLYLGIAFVF